MQTIGILVAEKTELHSKLQQMEKKCEKIQDENDELLGRLKASRQKITELERVIQSQQDQFGHGSPSFDSETTRYVENLKGELTSSYSVNEELRMRLNEFTDAASYRDEEAQTLQRSNLDLKSQLELLNIKIQQFSNNDVTDKKVEHYLTDVDDKLVTELKESNSYLSVKLEESEKALVKQRDEIKLEYQGYSSQLQHQVESLVDQINRMTDERESAFAKIDSMDQMLSKSNKQNDALLEELAKHEAALNENDSKTQEINEEPASNKEQLLENEIKYFKQQIELLVQDHNGLVKHLDEKEQELINLNKLVENYEKAREQHSALLEQTHNDKQALSRAIQQNKDLKQQLVELQDAYVTVTQQNLEITTKLQAEEFKLSQMSRVEQDEPKEADDKSETKSNESSEWNDDENKENASLMDGIKKRIDDLEKENKDLNDYISLVNKNLERQVDVAKETNDPSVHTVEQQEDIIDRQHKKIEELTIKIESTEVERDNLLQKLTEIEPPQTNSHSKNFILLEEKFTKVMQDNADLKDKNQELEHVVMQLQCETETIVDYITMYQLERKKLNQKYKEKDESIRSLSTQLQVNKLALHEINKNLTTFKKYSEVTIDTDTDESSEGQKKKYLLVQIEKILSQLTTESSTTLETVTNDIIKQNKETKQIPAMNLLDKTVQKSRPDLILCSACDGELFIV